MKRPRPKAPPAYPPPVTDSDPAGTGARRKRLTLKGYVSVVVSCVFAFVWGMSYFGIQYLELEILRKWVTLYSFRGSIFLEDRPGSGELFSARFESYSVTGSFKGLLEHTHFGFRLSRLRSGMLVVGIPYWFVAGCALGIFLAVRRRGAGRDGPTAARGGFEVQSSPQSTSSMHRGLIAPARA
jgi:hypothetical protein